MDFIYQSLNQIASSVFAFVSFSQTIISDCMLSWTNSYSGLLWMLQNFLRANICMAWTMHTHAVYYISEKISWYPMPMQWCLLKATPTACFIWKWSCTRNDGNTMRPAQCLAIEFAHRFRIVFWPVIAIHPVCTHFKHEMGSKFKAITLHYWLHVTCSSSTVRKNCSLKKQFAQKDAWFAFRCERCTAASVWDNWSSAKGKWGRHKFAVHMQTNMHPKMNAKRKTNGKTAT